MSLPSCPMLDWLNGLHRTPMSAKVLKWSRRYDHSHSLMPMFFLYSGASILSWYCDACAMCCMVSECEWMCGYAPFSPCMYDLKPSFTGCIAPVARTTTQTLTHTHTTPEFSARQLRPPDVEVQNLARKKILFIEEACSPQNRVKFCTACSNGANNSFRVHTVWWHASWNGSTPYHLFYMWLYMLCTCITHHSSFSYSSFPFHSGGSSNLHYQTATSNIVYTHRHRPLFC